MVQAKAFVFLADGFEEIEAFTPVDLLRRGGVEVVTVGVTGKTVTGSHGISVLADCGPEGFALPPEATLVVLPGGMPGTTNLAQSALVQQALRQAAGAGAYIGAICAAPLVLQEAGLLEGKRFTAFPGKIEAATGASVEQDGLLITARSAGVALAFSKTLLAALTGEEHAAHTLALLYPD